MRPDGGARRCRLPPRPPPPARAAGRWPNHFLLKRIVDPCHGRNKHLKCEVSMAEQWWLSSEQVCSATYKRRVTPAATTPSSAAPQNRPRPRLPPRRPPRARGRLCSPRGRGCRPLRPTACPCARRSRRAAPWTRSWRRGGGLEGGGGGASRGTRGLVESGTFSQSGGTPRLWTRLVSGVEMESETAMSKAVSGKCLGSVRDVSPLRRSERRVRLDAGAQPVRRGGLVWRRLV